MSSTLLAGSREWFRRSRRGRVLLGLFLLLLPAFTLTAFTTRTYRREQQRLAADYSARGERALRDGRPAAAIEELRTAMSLVPTRPRRLRLAQALAAAGRDAEARAHLLTLREGAPGDGVINLELARVAARDGNVADAAHYYRNAIEGAWDAAPDRHRRDARLELADLLVRRGTPAQAEAELITLAADLPQDAALHVRVGDLLMQAQQVRRAFDVYVAALRVEPAHTRATQGAGEAAFRLANYVTARRFFTRVAGAESGNAYVRGRLETVNAVIGLDPFGRGLAARERARRAALAFDIATRRLGACHDAQGPSAPGNGTDTAPSGGAAGEGLAQLAAEAHALDRRVHSDALSRDADLRDEVMDLVFRIEEGCDARCGAAGHGSDEALVLIARDRRATER
jgi:tetratricopeptide (TPR) repeat protein